MLRTGAGYQYTKFTASDSTQEYKIAINDEVSFILATNNGERIIDPLSVGTVNTSTNIGGATISYMVDFDGTINLPVIGRVKLCGLTIREAEKFLEENFQKYYNNPFVQLKVINNRVIIFPGGTRRHCFCTIFKKYKYDSF